jgi:GNAT superfamily N-acetyltransferase
VNVVIEALAERHDRSSFVCGNAALDRHLKAQASQDVRRRISACYVGRAVADEIVVAYYTLSAASILLDALPAALAKRLPRYPTVPAARIGRLAVDRRCRGQGLGGMLLADALGRILRAEIACYAAVVDAKDEGAAQFYRHHGFIPFAQDARMLFLPLRTVSGLARQ